MARAVCHGCGEEIEILGVVGRRDACQTCDAELHACVMCKMYEPRSPKACREPQAEPPRDKDRGNFCDFFELGRGPSERSGAAEDARRAFDALFAKRR